MKREDAYKGARVIALDEQDGNCSVIGKTGTIVYTFGDWCRVCFDEDVNGHVSEAYGPSRHCWDMMYDRIEIYDAPDPEIVIVFDDLEL